MASQCQLINYRTLLSLTASLTGEKTEKDKGRFLKFIVREGVALCPFLQDWKNKAAASQCVFEKGSVLFLPSRS